MRDAASANEFSEFERRYIETVAWCTAHVNPVEPASSLRSPDLNPGEIFARREPRPWSGETLEYGSLEDVAALDRLACRRRELLHGPPTSLAPQPGRLLLVWPQDTLFTQVMHPGSDGFFELNGDLPPWDTWIAYLIAPRDRIRASWTTARYRPTEALVCWIPEAFIGLAERGLAESEIDMGAWVPSNRPLKVLHEEIVLSLA